MGDKQMSSTKTELVVGSTFQKMVEDIVVAKMDASVNDMPLDFDVQSLPAMYLSFANNALETGEAVKPPMRVEITSSEDAFVSEAVKFLRNHSSADLSTVNTLTVTEPTLKKKEKKEDVKSQPVDKR